MIATLLIAAAYALPALLARKRKIGTGKAVLMSILLSPFIALPLVLASKKRPAEAGGSGKARELDDPKKSVREKTGEDMNGYGYKEGGRIISDSIILSEAKDNVSLGQKVPPERRHSVSPVGESKSRSVHL